MNTLIKLLKILPLGLALLAFSFGVTHTQAEEEYLIYLPLVIGHESGSTPPIGLAISQITDNRGDYQGNQIPKYEKLEITFQVKNSVAQNFQFPYDAAPPPGIDLENSNYQGITVNAEFTSDNWQTTNIQPAFYYQEFDDEIHRNTEWFYPTDNYSWKVRFSPDQPGVWQYKLSVQDASGSFATTAQSFTVTDSQNSGFVQVSNTDSRYFEFEEGTYFPGLGYNLNYNEADWVNPTISNQPKFQTMNENGIQLFRIWLSQWSIYGSAWNPWNSPDPDRHSRYIPINGLATGQSYLGNEISMMLAWDSGWFSPCMFIGTWKAKPAVKTYTDYQVQVRYKVGDLEGPRIPNQPYGFVAKTGDWLWGSEYCYDPGAGDVVAASYANPNWRSYPDPVDPTWMILEGTFNSQHNDFLPNFYLSLENVSAGRVYVDNVSIKEVINNQQFGANIVSKASMAHHLYFEQRNSYAFDKLLEMAKENNIYLRPVILEKNEWISNLIGPDGNFSSESVDNFYGEWRQETKGRWLQKAWWRYLQARWGYSANIHSWELLNEGNPNSSRHYVLADELGKYMQCEVFGIQVSDQNGAECTYDHPNAHLVSTSFWTSFPADNFWANPDYANIDYADVHAYVSTGWLRDPEHENCATAYHLDYGRNARNRMNTQAGSNVTKPIIRGEAGIDYLTQQVEQADLQYDSNGVWLHNYNWASLDGNALIEEYWWTLNLNQQPGPDGDSGLHEIFGYFTNFIQDIPLNNGHYQDVAASSSNPQLTIVGQKDTNNGRAHLWVKNRNHTWRNVVDGINGISGLSGTLTIDGFNPNTSYTTEWYEFTTLGSPSIRYSTVTSNNSGSLTINLPTDPQITDVGIKISQ